MVEMQQLKDLNLNKEVSDLKNGTILSIHEKKSKRKTHWELWHHISGCRQWFKAQRDTATHEIFQYCLKLMSEEIHNETDQYRLNNAGLINRDKKLFLLILMV